MAETGVTVDGLKIQLAQVQAAISACLLTGQSYTRPGLGVTRVSLAELRKQATFLARQISRSQDGAVSVSEVSGVDALASGDPSWSGAQ